MTRRSSTRIVLIAAAICAASAPCLAQSATVRITHNDSDGIVIPGQTVQITTTVAWTQTGADMLVEIEGGVRATPNAGAASSPTFPYSVAPGPNLSIVPGVASLGSVDGLHISNYDLGWIMFVGFPPEPWGLHAGLAILRHDWTAPTTPGAVVFDWIPSAGLPEPLFAFRTRQPWVQPAPATYLGTSLTVIPAPSAALMLALGLCGATSARRRR